MENLVSVIKTILLDNILSSGTQNIQETNTSDLPSSDSIPHLASLPSTTSFNTSFYDIRIKPLLPLEDYNLFVADSNHPNQSTKEINANQLHFHLILLLQQCNERSTHYANQLLLTIFLQTINNIFQNNTNKNLKTNAISTTNTSTTNDNPLTNNSSMSPPINLPTTSNYQKKPNDPTPILHDLFTHLPTQLLDTKEATILNFLYDDLYHNLTHETNFVSSYQWLLFFLITMYVYPKHEDTRLFHVFYQLFTKEILHLFASYPKDYTKWTLKWFQSLEKTSNDYSVFLQTYSMMLNTTIQLQMMISMMNYLVEIHITNENQHFIPLQTSIIMFLKMYKHFLPMAMYIIRLNIFYLSMFHRYDLVLLLFKDSTSIAWEEYKDYYDQILGLSSINNIPSPDFSPKSPSPVKMKDEEIEDEGYRYLVNLTKDEIVKLLSDQPDGSFLLRFQQASELSLLSPSGDTISNRSTSSSPPISQLVLSFKLPNDNNSNQTQEATIKHAVIRREQTIPTLADLTPSSKEISHYTYRCGKLGPTTSLYQLLREISQIIAIPLLFNHFPQETSTQSQPTKQTWASKPTLDINTKFWYAINQEMPRILQSLSYSNEKLSLVDGVMAISEDEEETGETTGNKQETTGDFSDQLSESSNDTDESDLYPINAMRGEDNDTNDQFAVFLNLSMKEKTNLSHLYNFLLNKRRQSHRSKAIWELSWLHGDYVDCFIHILHVCCLKQMILYTLPMWKMIENYWIQDFLLFSSDLTTNSTDNELNSNLISCQLTSFYQELLELLQTFVQIHSLSTLTTLDQTQFQLYLHQLFQYQTNYQTTVFASDSISSLLLHYFVQIFLQQENQLVAMSIAPELPRYLPSYEVNCNEFHMMKPIIHPLFEKFYLQPEEIIASLYQETGIKQLLHQEYKEYILEQWQLQGNIPLEMGPLISETNYLDMFIMLIHRDYPELLRGIKGTSLIASFPGANSLGSTSNHPGSTLLPGQTTQTLPANAYYPSCIEMNEFHTWLITQYEAYLQDYKHQMYSTTIFLSVSQTTEEVYHPLNKLFALFHMIVLRFFIRFQTNALIKTLPTTSSLGSLASLVLKQQQSQQIKSKKSFKTSDSTLKIMLPTSKEFLYKFIQLLQSYDLICILNKGQENVGLSFTSNANNAPRQYYHFIDPWEIAASSVDNKDISKDHKESVKQSDSRRLGRRSYQIPTTNNYTTGTTINNPPLPSLSNPTTYLHRLNLTLLQQHIKSNAFPNTNPHWLTLIFHIFHSYFHVTRCFSSNHNPHSSQAKFLQCLHEDWEHSFLFLWDWIASEKYILQLLTNSFPTFDIQRLYTTNSTGFQSKFSPWQENINRMMYRNTCLARLGAPYQMMINISLDIYGMKEVIQIKPVNKDNGSTHTSDNSTNKPPSLLNIPSKPTNTSQNNLSSFFGGSGGGTSLSTSSSTSSFASLAINPSNNNANNTLQNASSSHGATTNHFYHKKAFVTPSPNAAIIANVREIYFHVQASPNPSFLEANPHDSTFVTWNKSFPLGTLTSTSRKIEGIVSSIPTSNPKQPLKPSALPLPTQGQCKHYLQEVLVSQDFEWRQQMQFLLPIVDHELTLQGLPKEPEKITNNKTMNAFSKDPSVIDFDHASPKPLTSTTSTRSLPEDNEDPDLNFTSVKSTSSTPSTLPSTTTPSFTITPIFPSNHSNVSKQIAFYQETRVFPPKKLILSIYEKQMFFMESKLGEIEIDLNQLTEENMIQDWFPVINPQDKSISYFLYLQIKWKNNMLLTKEMKHVYYTSIEQMMEAKPDKVTSKESTHNNNNNNKKGFKTKATQIMQEIKKKQSHFLSQLDDFF